MNWLDLSAYVPGLCAVVVLGMAATVAEKAYRWFRPQPVDTPAQTLAFHDTCLDGQVINLAAGWTGTWPDLDRHLATLAEQEPQL